MGKRKITENSTFLAHSIKTKGIYTLFKKSVFLVINNLPSDLFLPPEHETCHHKSSK